jgi:hypothetical protein
MYIQNPSDKLRNLKLFKSNVCSKISILFWTFAALVLTFLPTILTISNGLFSYNVYYTDIRIIGQEEAQGGAVPALIPDNEIYPIFDSFLEDDDMTRYMSRSPYAMDTYQVLKAYLHRNLKKQVDPNPSGVWYNGLSDFDRRWRTRGGRRKRIRYPQYSLQKADAITGTYTSQDSNMATYTFGLQNQDSFTLRLCAGINGATLVTNFTEFEGHRIQAIRGALPPSQICYPVSDSSLPILVQPRNQKLQPSVLDSNDRAFRPSQLSGMMALTAITLSVSGMDLNSTHISMGVKKTAHVTVYNMATDIDHPDKLLDCSPEALYRPSSYSSFLDVDSSPMFINVSHTRRVCALYALSQQNPDMPIWQASRRAVGQNSSLNAVYTYLAGTPASPFGGYMVDLTWFTAYTVAAPIAVFPEDNKEYLVAHLYNDDPNIYSFRTTGIEDMLNFKDPYEYSFDIMTENPLLADLVLTRAALLQGNTYYFTMTQATPRYSVDTNYGWRILIAIISCLTLIIWVLLGRKMDEKVNLRSMLIDTVIVNENIVKEEELCTVVNGVRGPVRQFSTKQEFGKPARLGFAKGYMQELPILTMNGTPLGTYSTE